jgi:hypothetical protein
MKILPRIAKVEAKTLGFYTSLELAAGGLLTALLIRWASS